MQIAIEGTDAANNWKSRATDLNQRTETTLREVSTLLEQVNTFAEGTLVDEIVDVGSTLVNATTHLMEGMNMIFSVVEGLLSKLAELFTAGTRNTQDTKQYMG